MPRITRRIALAVAGLIVGLVLAEVVLLVMQPVSAEDLLPLPEYPRRFRRLVSGDSYIRFDATLGWVTSPNVTRKADGVTYRTNRAGLRADREYATDPPSGGRRLAAFGDSYTYCHEANLSDCWTTKLERALPGSEVLNFGVPGYGPDQAWLRYKRDGPTFEPCAVLIGYMIENVNRVVNRYRPFLVPETDLIASKPRFLLAGDGLTLLPNPATHPEQLTDPSWVERVVGEHDRWYFPGVLVPNPLDGIGLVRLARTAAYKYQHGGELAGMARAYRDRGEAYQVAGRVLVEFAREVRRDGATPVVIIFSPADEIEAGLRGDGRLHAPLVEWLAREGVPTIDVTDALTEEARRSGVPAVVRYHYRPLGNEVVARTLAERLPGLIGQTCVT